VKKVIILMCLLIVSCSELKCRLSVMYIDNGEEIEYKNMTGNDFMPGIKCDF
jgi:hypothetical protein